MIDAILTTYLRADSFIASKLATYAHKPAIFADIVPKNATFPNLTIRAMTTSSNETIETFNVYIDYWDYETKNSSREDSKIVCNHIKNILDGYRFTGMDARYSDVRFRFLSGYPATPDEYDGVHYNLFFSVRAIRKEWMQGIPTTTEE
jgi:hypothetical protein